jgi:hypothetical protein
LRVRCNGIYDFSAAWTNLVVIDKSMITVV